MVGAAIRASGYYIMLCTHRYTQREREARRVRIRDAIVARASLSTTTR